MSELGSPCRYRACLFSRLRCPFTPALELATRGMKETKPGKLLTSEKLRLACLGIPSDHIAGHLHAAADHATSDDEDHGALRVRRRHGLLRRLWQESRNADAAAVEGRHDVICFLHALWVGNGAAQRP